MWKQRMKDTYRNQSEETISEKNIFWNNQKINSMQQKCVLSLLWLTGVDCGAKNIN